MVLFLSLFIPLRVYAGGAHMNSLWKCGICSLAIIIVVGLAFKYDVGGGYMDICLGLLCCGTICILAPQDTEIKRLYPSEKKTQRNNIENTCCDLFVNFYVVIQHWKITGM